MLFSSLRKNKKIVDQWKQLNDFLKPYTHFEFGTIIKPYIMSVITHNLSNSHKYFNLSCLYELHKVRSS